MDECNDILRIGTEQEQIIQLYKAVKALSKMGVYTIMAGVWNAETNYNKKQMLVSYDNASYIKRIDGDCVNESPTLNPDKWQLISAGTPGAMGPQGVPGIGIDTLTDVNLTLGDTTVQYDTTNGLQITSTGRFTYENGQKDATVDLDIPIIPGQNISIDKANNKKQVVIKTVSSPTFDDVKLNKTLTLGEEYENYTSVIDSPSHNQDITFRFSYGATKEVKFSQLLKSTNVKTLFGNQSIVGIGNIDLYRHVVYMTASGSNGAVDICVSIVNSNGNKIDSLTDLFTQLADYAGKVYPATGYFRHTINGPITYINPVASGGFTYWSQGESGQKIEILWSKFTFTITDNLTTV